MSFQKSSWSSRSLSPLCHHCVTILSSLCQLVNHFHVIRSSFVVYANKKLRFQCIVIRQWTRQKNQRWHRKWTRTHSKGVIFGPTSGQLPVLFSLKTVIRLYWYEVRLSAMVASVFLAINNENPRPVHQKPGRKSRPEVQTGSDFFDSIKRNKWWKYWMI